MVRGAQTTHKVVPLLKVLGHELPGVGAVMGGLEGGAHGDGAGEDVLVGNGLDPGGGGVGHEVVGRLQEFGEGGAGGLGGFDRVGALFEGRFLCRFWRWWGCCFGAWVGWRYGFGWMGLR